MKMMSCWLIAALGYSCNARAAETESNFIVQENEQGSLVSEGGQPVLFYQRAARSLDGKFERANYVHPLYDLDGSVLTEDFPADHRHHRGIFWAWHQFWIGEKKIGDAWATEDFVWEVTKVETQIEKDSATLTAQVTWKSPQWTGADGRQKPLVHETTTIRVHRSTDDARKIDFEIRLLAAEDEVRIGGSDDDKGYGGFSVRVQLSKDVQFTGRDGRVEPLRTAVEAGPWIDVSGSLSEPGKQTGVAILCHPTTPGYPQQWILRNERSMQNPVYPGRRATALSKETPTVLRYRLVVHRGAADRATVDKWHAQYASGPVAEQ